MKKAIKLNRLLLGLMLFGLASCAVTDIDRTANFSALKTFAWGDANIKVENPVYESGLIHKNIRRTIEAEFNKRGIQLTTKNADFIVDYHTYTEEKGTDKPPGLRISILFSTGLLSLQI